MAAIQARTWQLRLRQHREADHEQLRAVVQSWHGQDVLKKIQQSVFMEGENEEYHVTKLFKQGGSRTWHLQSGEATPGRSRRLPTSVLYHGQVLVLHI